MNKKTVISIILTLCLVFGILPLSFSAEAKEATVDGIKYLINTGGTEAAVAYQEEQASGDIDIPEKVEIDGKEYTVTGIDYRAFNNCDYLSSVHIPATITSIGEKVFCDCSSLFSITVDEANPSFVSKDGVLFTESGDTLICYPASKSGDSYDIPDGVKYVANHAFYDCILKKVTFPSSVKSIGTYAFYSSSINEITFEEGLESIGNYAFAECYGLESLALPSTLKSIGDFAFNVCRNLKSLYFAGSKEAWGKVEKGKYWSQTTQLGADPAAKQVTFKVANGSWNDGTTVNRIITVIGDKAVLTEKALPAVGKKPSENYVAGSWDPDPLNTDITDGAMFTYSYKKPKVTITVKSQTYPYTGYPQGETDPVYDDSSVIEKKVKVKGLMSEDQIARIVLTGAETDVGVYTDKLNATGVKIKDAKNNDVTGKYDIEIIPGTLTIYSVPVQISVVDVSDGQELEGATVHILDSNNDVVTSWTSAAEPHEVQGLKVGEEYTIKETVAPEGYLIPTEITFSVKEGGTIKTTASLTEDGVLLVENEKTSVRISVIDVADGEELAGAKVQILDRDGNAAEGWDSTNEAYGIAGLKTGEEYTVHETVAPEGYILATDTKFVISEGGRITSTGSVNEDGVLLVENAKTSVQISVVDVADGYELEGAHVLIYDSDGNVAEEWNSTNKAHGISGLKTGEEYTVHETVTPEGYIIATDTTFVISENGNLTPTGSVTEDGVLLVENEKTFVKISVVDVEDGYELAGAKVQILDSDGNVAEEWDSTNEAHEIAGLKTGEEYTVHETVAPEGYILATDTTFVISEGGSITSTGSTATDEEGNTVLLVENKITSVSFIVKDSDGNPVEGASLEILDGNGNMVEDWTSVTEAHTVEGLKTGETYTLHQASAPENYSAADDETFIISLTGKLSTEAVVEDGVIVLTNELTTAEVTVTVSPTEGGTAEGGGTYTINESVTVTATVNDLYVFEGWFKGEESLSEDLEYTFTVKENITLTAKFREKTEYTVIWLNGDGSELDRKTYLEGEDEPTTNKKPVKKEDEKNYYTFVRWNKGSVEGNTKTYKPLFSILEKVDCTVIWLNGDGKVLDKKTYKMFSAEPKTTKKAVKAEDADYRYIFRGWDEGTVSPGGTKKTYTPLFTAIPKPTYYVEWLNYDGTILDSKTYKEGQPEPKTAKIPTRPDDEKYTYTFDKWSNGVTIGRTKTYSPLFKSTAKTVYTVFILDENGKTVETLTFTEGQKEPAPKSNPKKAEDDKYTYVFDKWERTVSGTKITYKPVFKAIAKPEPEPEKTEPKEYVILWLNGDGTILDAATYKEGNEIPSTDKIPVKAEDEAYAYAFVVWTQKTDGYTITFTPAFAPYQKPIANPETSDGGTEIILVVLLVVSLAVALILIFGKKRGEQNK